jgi:hypothetical protein
VRKLARFRCLGLVAIVVSMMADTGTSMASKGNGGGYFWFSSVNYDVGQWLQIKFLCSWLC